MHAAAAGSLPATLEEVTVVPVPNDPATSAPRSAIRSKGTWLCSIWPTRWA